MAVYLDSSAIVKLVVAEPGSTALRTFLRRHAERVSCALAVVEVTRAVRRQGKPAEDRASRVLGRVRLLSIDHALLQQAAALDVALLRSLDAIHLASARTLGDDLVFVVTYDRRMSEAAVALGMPVRSPGVPKSRLEPRVAPRTRRRAARSSSPSSS